MSSVARFRPAQIRAVVIAIVAKSGHQCFRLRAQGVLLLYSMSSPFSRRIAVRQLPTKLRRQKLLYNIRTIQLRTFQWHEHLATCATHFALFVAVLMGTISLMHHTNILSGILVMLGFLVDTAILYLLAICASQFTFSVFFLRLIQDFTLVLVDRRTDSRPQTLSRSLFCPSNSSDTIPILPEPANEGTGQRDPHFTAPITAGALEDDRPPINIFVQGTASRGVSIRMSHLFFVAFSVMF